MVNKITHFSDIAMEISENQYAQTLLLSQLSSNFLVDSLHSTTEVILQSLGSKYHRAMHRF